MAVITPSNKPRRVHPVPAEDGAMPWIPLTLGALAALLLALAPGAELDLKARPLPQEPLACLGETRSLIVANGMPYTPVRVQGRTGFFVVDLGADGSAISPGTFLRDATGGAADHAADGAGRGSAGSTARLAGGAAGPMPLPGSSDRFAGVDFFGPWAPLRLSVQDHSGIRGPLPQAGLIGTDLLSTHVITLDYANGLLRRATAKGFCSDGELRRAGFLPLSSRDYYGSSSADLRCPAAPRRGGCPNIPTIPVWIGSVTAVAQVDTGYADSLQPPSMNINQALLERLERAGVPLIRVPDADLSLSSCVRGEVERVLAYRLSAGSAVELVGSNGSAVRRLPGVTLFLKDSPAAIKSCGGIGTWSEPAAQLGASFVNDGTLVVDPFSQRLWFRGWGAAAGR